MKGIKLRKILAGLLVSAFAVTTFSLPANAVTTNVKAVSNSSNEDLDRKIIGYFPEWAIGSEVQGNFDAADLQWEYLTHIQYSFMGVGADNKITFLDAGSKKRAIEDSFEGHEFTYKMNGKTYPISMDPSLPFKGHFNTLATMKKKFPDVKLVMSVGGWAASRGFYTMLDTDEGINTFADSCVDFLRKYDFFDGIDIDFEYPTSTSTAGNPADADLSEPRRGILNARYNVMMKTLREKLDEAGKKDNKDYVLSAAVTASAWVLGGVTDNSYAKYLDFLSVMSYDFHGGWNHFVENLANIYPDPADTETIQMAMPTLCMDWAYRFYRGVLPSEKILMGIPYYTRGWENVRGGNNGLHGTAGSAQGSTPAGGKYNLWGDDDNKDGKPDPAGANPLWHVLNLMEEDPNMNKHWDNVGKVPYVWQSTDKVFLSFEDEQSIDERVKYVKDKNLGGALIWVMNGDYGLNPNYEPGSSDPNKGKYTFGDTLTKRLSNGFDNIGPCKVSDERPEGEDKPEVIECEVQTSMKYDHPNGENTITVKGVNGNIIPKGWTVEFDMPKSAIFTSVENGTFEIVSENETFTRVKVTSSVWNDSVVVKSKLCYSGLRNIRVNGKVPVNVPVNNNFLPTISGVSDKVLTVGDTFNKLAGVTANDVEDGDLTNSIVCENGVKTNEAGYYNLEYVVIDSANAASTKKVVVYVLPQEYSSAKSWEAGMKYTKGEFVLYQGSIYKLKDNVWYVPSNILPNDSAYFDVVTTLENKTFLEGDDNPNKEVEDVNKDGKVDVLDLSAVAKSYNAKKGTSSYKAEYDLKSDSIIDLYDLVKVAKKIK